MAIPMATEIAPNVTAVRHVAVRHVAQSAKPYRQNLEVILRLNL
jgi:hypothetical protein